MNTFNRKISLFAAIVGMGLFGSIAANAAESSQSTGAACHQVTRKVAVWPVGGNPKLQQSPRFVTRTLMACDHGRGASKPARSAAAPTYGPRAR